MWFQFEGFKKCVSWIVGDEVVDEFLGLRLEFDKSSIDQSS